MLWHQTWAPRGAWEEPAKSKILGQLPCPQLATHNQVLGKKTTLQRGGQRIGISMSTHNDPGQVLHTENYVCMEDDVSRCDDAPAARLHWRLPLSQID